MSFLEKFGLGKSEQTTSAPENISFPEKDINVMPTVEDFRVILENDKDISVEELEALTGVNPAEFLQTLTGEENINIRDIKDFHERISAAQAEAPEEYKDSNLRKLANNNFVKAGVLSLILFLKFAPHAEAAHSDKPSDAKKYNTEAAKKSETKIDGGDKTYHYDGTSPDANKSLERLAKLDLTNSYETDKADISAESQANIEAQVHDFLAGINPNNYHDLMTKVWKISGSSDQRLTNTWEGGNEELTKARIAAAEQIIKAAINNFDYSHSGFSEEQIAGLKDKPFSYDIFESKNGQEKGVTYLTDLKNPDSKTGDNYTSQEIKEIQEKDPQKYFALLEKCRYINVNLMAESDNMPKMENRPAELTPHTGELKALENKIPELSGYKSVMILEDNSASMQGSKEALAQYLEDNYQANTKVSTASYSATLDNFKPAQDMRDASQSLRQMRSIGSSNERTIDCSIKAMQLFQAQEKAGDGLFLCGTDEALQKVSFNDLMTLQKLGAEKNTDIQFLIIHTEKGNRITENIPLEEVIKNFTDSEGVFEKTKARLEHYANLKTVSEHTRAEFQARLNNLSDTKFTMNKLVIDNGEGGAKEIQLVAY
ncbi:MAG: hypothetical protein WC467_04415 [Patescibacteria group bacterium]